MNGMSECVGSFISLSCEGCEHVKYLFITQVQSIVLVTDLFFCHKSNLFSFCITVISRILSLPIYSCLRLACRLTKIVHVNAEWWVNLSWGHVHMQLPALYCIGLRLYDNNLYYH